MAVRVFKTGQNGRAGVVEASEHNLQSKPRVNYPSSQSARDVEGAEESIGVRIHKEKL